MHITLVSRKRIAAVLSGQCNSSFASRIVKRFDSIRDTNSTDTSLDGECTSKYGVSSRVDSEELRVLGIEMRSAPLRCSEAEVTVLVQVRYA